MKRSCTLLFCLAFFVFTKAQVNKSDKLLGGSFNGNFIVNQSDPNAAEGSNIGFSPSFGWAIKKNLVMGLKGAIGFSRSENTNNTIKSTSSIISVAPGIFLTHYQQLKNQLGITLTHEAFVGYSQIKTSNGTVKNTTKSRSAGYRFSPGVYYRFSDRFFGQASIGEVYANWGETETARQINAGIRFLQSFQLGINYRVGKRNS